MSQIADSDLRYCQELVCTPAGILTSTHRFLSPDQRAKLLALHALFGAIRSIPFTVSDPGISNTKLAWWHHELEPTAQIVSQHPVVRACQGLGVFVYFTPSLIQRYLAAWARFAPGEPIQSLSLMREMVLNVGAIEAALEVDVLTEESKSASLQNAGAAVSMAFFIDKFDSKLSGESWWLPLELQARYGVTYSSFKNPHHRHGLRSAITAVGKLGLEFCSQASLELNSFRLDNKGSKGARHLEACVKIAERRIRKRMANPRTRVSRKPSFAEVFIAWRGALR